MLRSKDDEIKRLKEELWFARTTIIDLVPAPFCEFFRGYYHCNTRSEGYEWRRNLVAEIIENTPVDDQENFGFQRTTRCPLCDDSPSHFYRDGFTGCSLDLIIDSKINYILARHEVRPKLFPATFTLDQRSYFQKNFGSC